MNELERSGANASSMKEMRKVRLVFCALLIDEQLEEPEGQVALQSAWKFSKFEGSQAVSSCQLDPLRQPSKNLAVIPLRPEGHRHGRGLHPDRQDEGGELLVASWTIN